jgi:hypothetical protein
MEYGDLFKLAFRLGIDLQTLSEEKGRDLLEGSGLQMSMASQRSPG